MEKLVALNKHYRQRGWMDNANGISQKIGNAKEITHIAKDTDILTDGMVNAVITKEFDPVFTLPFDNWGAEVVIHFQSSKIVAASKLCRKVQLSDVDKTKVWDQVVEPLGVPIIESRAFEANYGEDVCGTWAPKHPAIIVKSRGLYAWGKKLRDVCNLCESIHSIIESNLDLLWVPVRIANDEAAPIVWA